jgi:hypothetical protein
MQALRALLISVALAFGPASARRLLDAVAQETAELYVTDFSRFPNQTYPSYLCPRGGVSCTNGTAWQIQEQRLSSSTSYVNVTGDVPTELYGTFALDRDAVAAIFDTFAAQVRSEWCFGPRASPCMVDVTCGLATLLISSSR